VYSDQHELITKQIMNGPPQKCIACALCETVCTVDAIPHIEDVPKEEISYILINKDFFTKFK